MNANEPIESVLADVLGPPGSCVAFLLVAADMVVSHRPETLPRVAMDAAGNAIAVWYQGDSFYYNVFSATGVWGAAVQVDTSAVNSNFTASLLRVRTKLEAGDSATLSSH